MELASDAFTSICGDAAAILRWISQRLVVARKTPNSFHTLVAKDWRAMR